MIFHRENARFSYPVELTANFFVGGQYIDPIEIDRVEIWRGGEGVENGGTLVDVIGGSHIIKNGAGRYKVIWDPYLEGSSPLPSPGQQGPGSPNQGSSPNDPANIVPQDQYYDVWFLKISYSEISYRSVSFKFFLYPDDFFADTDTSKWRYELKPDRKKIIRGENLDIRLEIIPIPLFKSKRDPIVEYVLSMSSMKVQILDQSNSIILPWTEVRFTGKEGIFQTNVFSPFQLGDYSLVVDLLLPNGKSIRYPKYLISLED